MALADTCSTSKGTSAARQTDLFLLKMSFVLFSDFSQTVKTNKGSEREELPRRSAQSQLLQDTKRGGTCLHPHRSRA